MFLSYATMKRVIHRAVIFLMMLLLCSRRVAAATPAEVDAAIEKGKKLLYSLQRPGGYWEFDDHRVGAGHNNEQMQGDTFGGFTAIATYALLASGESPQDPRMAAAIQFLINADVIGIYSLGVRANVWPFLPPTDKAVKRCRSTMPA